MTIADPRIWSSASSTSDGGRPHRPVLLEHRHHERAERGRQLGLQTPERNRMLVHDRVQHRQRRIAGERQSARQHLVEHDAERKDVGRRADGLAADLFRRHVRRRADDGALRGDARRGLHLGRGLLRQRDVRKPEVEHLDVPVGPDHHVLGFDVAVHDAGARARSRALWPVAGRHGTPGRTAGRRRATGAASGLRRVPGRCSTGRCRSGRPREW